MDKNTFIGLFLIGAILIGFSYFNGPTEAEIERSRQMRDSIEAVQAENAALEQQRTESIQSASDTVGLDSSINAPDSLKSMQNESLYGVFASHAIGEEKEYLIENEKMIIRLSSLGGRVKSVELKGYQTYDSSSLFLFDESSKFNLNFFTKDNKNIFTDELYFTANTEKLNVSGEDKQTFAMRLQLAPDRYIEYVYGIQGNSFLIDFDINFVGMNEVISNRSSEVYLNWMINAPDQEKSMDNQRNVTTVFYKYEGEDADNISPSSDEKMDFEASIKWVSFKEQFFNATLIADNTFSKSGAFAATETDENNPDYVKTLRTSLTVPLDGMPVENFGMAFYFGPNKYNVLNKLENGMEDIIDLGWGIFGWINKIAVIPVFNFLDGFHLNYGIIILILTILLKLVLSPITYKTYLSSSKMRVLKPEVSELNEKFKDDPMKKQQAMMALYRQTGVNPLSGCIPMLIQMPILFAMYQFFPASIELRQESFLWAEDLSTYDSILDLSFHIPFYGSHVSLFTLLMALSMVFYTRMNSQMGGMGSASDGPMAAQMKIMMYVMPIMMLFFFNSYSAGLSYYYFLANVISILQTLLIRKVFIDEDAIRAKIEQNKKKPRVVKKSGFQKRMEEMAKQRGYQQPSKGKKKN